jgi:hypothetical protein
MPFAEQPQRSGLSRRDFFARGLLVSAAAALGSGPWVEAARAASVDLVQDTFNGLLAFVLPGSDAYSVAQGSSTVDRGGVDANVMDVLISTLDELTPFVPSFSAQVAAVLNGLALSVNPSPGTTFQSPFANLPFAQKVAVFQIMDATDQFKPLVGVLAAFIAFLCYSEAGTFDSATRTITARPLGWDLCNYDGVADGRNEFRGYFRGHSDRH